ncbi:hypothetical protein GCM10009738_03580 [Kitasatospora viridis]
MVPEQRPGGPRTMPGLTLTGEGAYAADHGLDADPRGRGARSVPALGGVTVVPQPGEREAGVLSFSAHAVVFTDEDPEWVRSTIAAASHDPPPSRQAGGGSGAGSATPTC